jgi:hypothetical protein
VFLFGNRSDVVLAMDRIAIVGEWIDERAMDNIDLYGVAL